MSWKITFVVSRARLHNHVRRLSRSPAAEDHIRRLSNSVTRSRWSTLKIPSCCSRSLFLVIVSNRELIAPEVDRACRYWVYMYEGSTHLRWLVVQVLFVHGGILPFATNSAGARLLRVVVLCMCKCMCKCMCMSCAGASAGAGAGAVQVQLQVMCGVCGVRDVDFFMCLLQHLERLFFCVTVFVYIFKSLNHWFFLELRAT